MIKPLDAQPEHYSQYLSMEDLTIPACEPHVFHQPTGLMFDMPDVERQWMSKECSSNSGTVCLDCSSGTYQSNWNTESSCNLHSYCDHNAGLEKVMEGTAERDVQCRCQSGRHCSSPSCETCVLNTACAPGHGVTRPANMSSDTQCSPCAEGTFSNVTSDTEPCRAWSSCDIEKEEQIPGTSSTDVTCSFMNYTPQLLVFLTPCQRASKKCPWFNRNKETAQKNLHQNGRQLVPQQDPGNVEDNVPVEDQDPVIETIIQGMPVAQEEGKDFHLPVVDEGHV
ncbi:tumor necrosis factor receptor superfamily member 5 [Rhinophrynus dorsalis]